MGFTAGIVSSMGIGTPHYYIDEERNPWDADTYANFHFDSSGSMNNIITPLQNAMTGPYFSSGSAAAQNGVKSTTSLRAELQDLYATGGIEGAPDWNTNSATNGADQYDLHINHRSISDEKWLTWPDKHYYNNGSSSRTWHALANANTVSNIVQVFVINESKDTTRGSGYMSTQFGEERSRSTIKTVTSATTNSTTVQVSNAATNISTTGAGNRQNQDDNGVDEPFAEHMKLTAVSQGTLNGTPTIVSYSGNTLTLSSAQTFAAGTNLTFTQVAKGFNSTSGSFHHSSPDDHAEAITDVNISRTVLYNGSGTPSSGIHQILNTGQKPSVTYIVIDAGLGQQRIGGMNLIGHTADAGNGPSNMTASQRHTQEGIIEGKLSFHATRVDGNNRSLNDFNNLLSWNEKQNLLHLTALYQQNQNTSVSYWKDQLRAALQLNLSF